MNEVRLFHTCMALAVRGGRLLLDLRRAGRPSRRLKRTAKGREWVTAADRRCQELFNRHLIPAFPRLRVIGEESLKHPAARRRGPWTLFVDPLDNTSVYWAGQNRFGILLSCLKRGRPVFSIAYFPASSPRMVTAWRRRGLQQWRFQKQIGRASAVKAVSLHRLRRAGGSVDIHPDSPQRYRPDRHPFDRRVWRAQRVVFKRVGRAPDQYGLLDVALGKRAAACGRRHFLWDVLPFFHMIEGRGGRVTDLNGHPILPLSRADLDGRHDYLVDEYIASAHPEIHRELLKALRK